MNLTIDILRRRSSSDAPYTQTVTVEADGNDTVAVLLDRINTDILADDPVQWDCSCRQKKCGACAMLINGKPRLACDTFLRSFGDGRISLAPLRKFPCVCDLKVDRSVMFNDLKRGGAWLEGDAAGDTTGHAYEASRCLQCGCCLEVCPNFYPGGEFSGAAVMVPSSRVISETPDSDRKRVSDAYKRNFYKGCGKSLACMDICPAGIDIERLLVKSNAVAVWGRRRSKRTPSP